MEKQVQVLVGLSVKPGNEATFREQIPNFIELVKKSEPDTLVYQWYLNASGDRCYVLENFADGEALLAHVNNVGPYLPDLFAIAPMTTWKILGNLSPSVMEAVVSLAAMNNLPVDVNGYAGGFVREAATV